MSKLYMSAITDTNKTCRTAGADRSIEIQVHYGGRDMHKTITIRVIREDNTVRLYVDGSKIDEYLMP